MDGLREILVCRMLPSSPLFEKYNKLQTMLCLLVNPQVHFNLANDKMMDSVEASVAKSQIEADMQEMIDYGIWMEAIQ